MNVRSADANDIIILSVGVMVGSTLVRHMVEKKGVAQGYGKPIVLGFFLAISLMILAIPLPTFTKGLALLGLVGAFAVNGPAIFKLVGAK